MTHTQQMPKLTTQLFIGTVFVGGRDEPIPDLNPANEQLLAVVSAGSADDVDDAVQSSLDAFNGAWGSMSGRERSTYLFKLADLIDRDADILAALEALDIGKPVHEPRSLDVPNAAATFRHFAGWADKITGSVISVPQNMGRQILSYTLREPIGVVGAIVPWNSPLMLAVWKIAPALSAGNTVVVKPPELAPLSLLHLARLIAEAGFPAGTVNVVPGLGSVAGEALAKHPAVAKISFTGSTATGRSIGEMAAQTFKSVSLELGGKSPHLIFSDADIEEAIASSAMGLFTNQGEVCASGTRILAHRDVYEQVVAGLAAAADAHVLGDPFDPSTTLGPLISSKQRDVVRKYIQAGLDDGARMAAGGSEHAGPGFFVRPTIFADATNQMTIAREEIFGPVGTVIPFDDTEEAVKLANDSVYGLTATIWTRDIGKAHTVAGRVQAGSAWINGWGVLDPALPWGGVKSSGVGQELGWTGILENTSEKVVAVNLSSGS